MSDIEVVIKINKDFIDKMNSIKDDRELSWSQLLTVYRGFHAMLQHGTILPKGHGRIGDLTKLYNAIDARNKGKDKGKYTGILALVTFADTIIEADKGE